MNRILVPLDGSERSEEALCYADAILKTKENGSLTVFRALESTRVSAWLPIEAMSLYEREVALVDDYLDAKGKELEGKPYQVKLLTDKGPGPVPGVAAACDKGEVDMIVMSGHGYSGWYQAVLGSNTERILHRSHIPVLVVKRPPTRPHSPTVFSNILIPLDGSKRAEDALTRAMDFGVGGTTRFTLVGVSSVFTDWAFEGDKKALIDPDTARIELYLEGQAEWIRNQGYDVDTVVRVGDPATELLELAKEIDIDLIFMTSHGRTGLAHWIYGSVAEKVLRYCEVSVLVLRGS